MARGWASWGKLGGMSITLLLLLAAFVTVIASAAGRCPLWIPVVLLVIVGLLAILPLG